MLVPVRQPSRDPRHRPVFAGESCGGTSSHGGGAQRVCPVGFVAQHHPFFFARDPFDPGRRTTPGPPPPPRLSSRLASLVSLLWFRFSGLAHLAKVHEPWACSPSTESVCHGKPSIATGLRGDAHRAGTGGPRQAAERAWNGSKLGGSWRSIWWPHTPRARRPST